MVSTSKERVLLEPTLFAGTGINSVDLQGVAYRYNNMSEAFANCWNLKKVSNINDYVYDMTGSFYQCWSLTNVSNLPKHLDTMGRNLQKNEYITGNMYYSSRSIRVSTENGTGSYRYFLVNPDNTDTVYVSSSNSTDMFIRLAYNINVTSATSEQLVIEINNTSYTLTFSASGTYTRLYDIDAGTFKSCSSITAVPSIPEHVTQMYHAFEFSGITETPDMSNVTGQVYMDSTFSGCGSLINATSLPINVVDLTSTFSGCSNLTSSPAIPNGITALYSTFSSCSNLTSIGTIPNSVKTLRSTFASCWNLPSVTNLPDSIEDISYAFQSCTNLTEIVLPNNVVELSGAFGYCSTLQNAPSLPNSVVSMYGTFQSCTSLINAPTIPNSVTHMPYTFQTCRNLVTAPNIPQSVINTTACFYGCTNLSGDVYIYSNKISDAYSMFYGTDTNVKNVYIPFTYFNGVNTATYNAFTAAGYDTAGTTNNVYLKDIVKKVNVTFNIIQSGTSHDIYMNGNKVDSNPMLIPVGTYQLVVYTPEEGIYTGEVIVSEDDIATGMTVTVDMTALTQLTLTLNCTLDDVTVPAEVTLSFTDALGNKHIINSNTAVVPEGTLVEYSASYVKNGDDYTANGEVNVQSTITSEVPLSKVVQEVVDLKWPFDDKYNTINTDTLLDDNNFIINNDSQAITSGPSSWHVDNGASYGYIKFKTPDESTIVSVTCSISSESNWDYGAIYVGTNIYQPTREQVKAGTTDGNGQYLMTGSGQVSKATYTATLEPNTVYYLMLIYVKDGSGNGYDDRLTVYDITFTSAPTKKWKVDMNENFTYTIDDSEVLELTRYIGTDGTVKVPEPVWR